MKYGYLLYRSCKPPTASVATTNLGDIFQSIAIIELYHKMGIPDEDIIPIDRYDISSYDGEEVILPMNCYDGVYYKKNFGASTFPIPDKIHPLFVSFHMDCGEELQDIELEEVKKYTPIGCRDEETYSFLSSCGINAYISGCLALTLPLRKYSENQQKVFLIDVSESISKLMPKELQRNSVALTQAHRHNSKSLSNRVESDEALQIQRYAYDRLRQLCDEAKLIVTRRLHVAVPCVAMGIPVVLVRPSWFDGRFAWLDKYLPMYTEQEAHLIDWYPIAPIVEWEKSQIAELFFSSVKSIASMQKVHSIYALRERQFNYTLGMDYDLGIAPLPEGAFEFAIVGANSHMASCIYDRLKEDYPQAELIACFGNGTSKFNLFLSQPFEEVAHLSEGTILFCASDVISKAEYETLKTNNVNPIIYVGSSAKEVMWDNFR